MNIFQINFHHAWGGQPNRVLTESIELTHRGHRVVVAGPRGCELCRRARAAGLATFEDLSLRRGFHPISQWHDVDALRLLFRRERFDILHTHGSQDTWATVFAARGMDSPPPIVRTRHNTFPIGGHPMNRWLYRKWIDHVITVSPQVNEYLTKKGLMRPEEITPIYSAPDLNRFDPGMDAPDLRSEFGLKPEHDVVTMVGRLAPEKGHQHLVNAAKILAPEFPNLRFLFVGKGRSRGDIKAQIASLGLGERIMLTGFRTDVPQILSISDIFVLSPTAGESLGTAILEGFLMELPAVATDVGGVCESVRDGQTGFLVPPGNAEALADALRKLLRDPELRERFGQAGRQMVLAEFTPRILAEKTEAVYSKVLAQRAAL